jgi:hypothetical protein
MAGEPLRLEQNAGDRIGCQHALRVTEQLGAIGLRGRCHDLLVERVEHLGMITGMLAGWAAAFLFSWPGSATGREDLARPRTAR